MTTRGGLWCRFDAVVARVPERIAILQGDDRPNFRELHRRALGAATRLVGLGVRPGDRCLLLAANTPALAAHMLAVWRLGAIVVLVNDGAPATHVAHAINLTAPVVVVVADRSDDPAYDGPVFALADDTAASFPQTALPDIAIDEGAPASILFTSGSTGLPKGVVQSHANLIAGCDMVAAHLGFRAEDRILCPIPWSFDYGFGQLLTTILIGITQILPIARDPFQMCAAIEAHRPTIFAGLPSLFALLVRGVSPIRETDLRSLRLVTNTGGKIPPAIFADLRGLFGHCALSLNYGLTESYRSAALPVDRLDKATSVGFAYPGVTLRILRDDGSEADSGEVGEIVHGGTGVFLGYWQAPEATAEALRPDPFSDDPAAKAVFTGDLGWKDAEGFLHIQGRRDRMIKSMGVRVSPDEIEGLIRASGLVADVAVVGLPHEMMGEMVAAAIVAQDGIDDPVRGLKRFVREAMSPPMQPRTFHLVDALPLTPNGKIDAPALRVLLGGNVR